MANFLPCSQVWLSCIMSTSRPRSTVRLSGTGLPVTSETFCRKSSVHSRPIGMLIFGISCFQVFSTNFFDFSSCQGCSMKVVIAFGASLISSWLVPPAYIRKVPSDGVSRTSVGSDSRLASTPISDIMRLSTR